MKKLLLLLVFVSTRFVTLAISTPPDTVNPEQIYINSVQAALHYQTGHITFPDGLGAIDVPKGFRYLDARQSNYVLTKLWGNPGGESLGMLFPADRGRSTRTIGLS
ncbi:MAG: DUF2167 domain-containing protein [Hymenobacter sp.]|nr:DUF2167 domain-containing protein [Hymenobacter sp.]